MDMYSKYCFDFLKVNHIEYLREIGFEKEETISTLYNEKYVPIIREQEENKVICKFCRKEEAIQRSQQMRSADEGETIVTYCNSCKKAF